MMKKGAQKNLWENIIKPEKLLGLIYNEKWKIWKNSRGWLIQDFEICRRVIGIDWTNFKVDIL
jgi:hypothetical protein